MKLTVTPDQLQHALDAIVMAVDSGKSVDLTIVDHKRTPPQNNALHLYFRMLANEMNDAGIDMRGFFKEGYFMDWSEKDIKERLWKPVQEALFDSKSTSQLTTKEVTQVYEVLNRKTAEHGISILFPSQS